MTVMRQVTFLLLGAGGVWNDDDGEQHARPIASHATLRGWSQKGEILDMLYGKLIIAC